MFEPDFNTQQDPNKIISVRREVEFAEFSEHEIYVYQSANQESVVCFLNNMSAMLGANFVEEYTIIYFGKDFTATQWLEAMAAIGEAA